MSNETKETPTKLKKKISSKQIFAIIGAVLLALLYVITLFVAIFDTSSSGRWFWMCLFSTIAIPILVWIYAQMYTLIQEKRQGR